MDRKEQFSPEESLKLIQLMIDRTRRTISVNSRYFLLWGWATFAIMINYIIPGHIFRKQYNEGRYATE
jgi:hypothetical protein